MHLGEKITTLVSEEKNAGNYEVSFDASSLPSRQGSALTSGIYLYKLQTSTFTESKKMALLK